VQAHTLYIPVWDELALVEERLLGLRRPEHEPLELVLQNVLNDGGKRIRPALTLLTGRLHEYKLDLLMPMATGVELLHTATLIHDDVVDKAGVRRRRPTTFVQWGPGPAVLAGDYLFAAAADQVAMTENHRVIRLFARTLMIIAQGELGQVFAAHSPPKADRDAYFERIGAKTATLFATATESGGILSEAPEGVVQALGDYGYNLGMAFQIVDDILDFIGDEEELGKPVGSDLLQGTLTLPAFWLMDSPPEDNAIKRYFRDRDPYDLATAIEAVRNSPGLEEAQAVAVSYGDRARRTLADLPGGPALSALKDLIDYVLDRRI
jgi:geranylgeranyl pyrophosphate synthase